MLNYLSKYIQRSKDYKKYLRENIRYLINLNRFAIKELKQDKIIRPCPICNIYDSTFIFKAPVCEFVKCKKCDLVYAKNIFREKGFQRFYENNKYYQDGWKKRYKILKKKKENKLLKTPIIPDKILKFLKNRNKCLDIGCSFGENLFYLKPYFKYVTGVELNIFTSKVGLELFGIKIYNKNLAKLKLKKSSYDCIILNQVIEHLDSLDIFYEINRLLKPGGIVYIGCPHMDSLSMKFLKNKHIHVYGIGHINMFNFSSFQKFAEKYKFKIKSFETDNHLDILLNDIVSIGSKRFIHRFNDVPFLNPINVGLFSFSNWFFNKTKLLSKYKLGSYLEIVLEKE